MLEQNWKLPKPHTTLGGVCDLTTASKKLGVKLADNSNNNVNDLLHDEYVNRFVKSYIRDQAKSKVLNI